MKQAAEIAEAALEQAGAVVAAAFDDVKDFLASEDGKKLRNYVATGLMVAAPAVASMPLLRRSRLGRLVELAGGATIIATVAEKIRDWEPNKPDLRSV